MNEKEYILNFITKNYTVALERENFYITTMGVKNKMTLNVFNTEMGIIFGKDIVIEDEALFTITTNWFSELCNELVKDLSDFITSLDYNMGSVKVLEETTKYFKQEKSNTFSDTFITKIIVNQFQCYLLPKLNEYLTEDKKIKGSKSILLDFMVEYHCSHHIEPVQAFISNYIMEWYGDNVVLAKVNDLLSQLVITLGTRNWVVTWIGHGPLSKATFLKQFSNELEDFEKYILKRFDDWYADEVIDSSERLLQRETYSTLPSLNLPNNFNN
jgi:hypothetical protein